MGARWAHEASVPINISRVDEMEGGGGERWRIVERENNSPTKIPAAPSCMNARELSMGRLETRRMMNVILLTQI
jgi:hypothetical protein